jgi:hypothetical protein
VDLQSFGPWPLFQFLSPIRSRYDSLDGGSARRKAATYTQNKRTQTSMPRVGLEPTIPVLERVKTVHALDRATTLIVLLSCITWLYYITLQIGLVIWWCFRLTGPMRSLVIKNREAVTTLLWKYHFLWKAHLWFRWKNMQVDVDLAHGSLHTVEMSSVINVSAVYAASIFRWQNIRSTRDTGYTLWTHWHYRNCPTTPTESSGKCYRPK